MSVAAFVTNLNIYRSMCEGQAQLGISFTGVSGQLVSENFSRNQHFSLSWEFRSWISYSIHAFRAEARTY